VANQSNSGIKAALSELRRRRVVRTTASYAVVGWLLIEASSVIFPILLLQLERLCRYITRPAVSPKRLSITRNGRVRYELKTPWRNGTTHVLFEPLDFISRLVSLVPKPRVNLTRFHGVFAPNSKYRARVTPARRGKRKKPHSDDETDQTPAEKQASMTWAKRLKRVFNIDIETCSECGGDVSIIASIEDPAVIRKILAHLDDNATSAASGLLPECRAPPSLAMNLFG
jgi:hypothetical protein